MAAMSLLDAVKTWPVDHLAAAVIDDGEVIASEGDQDQVFELASVTKLLSAYGVLLAIEEGAVELDSPAGPENATVRHLLAHASGLGFSGTDPVRRVGTRRVYSSAGYEELARYVAEQTGIGFPEYLEEGVFAPLGMTHTELAGSAGHGMRSTAADLCRFAREIAEPQLLAPETVAEAMSVQFPHLSGVVPGYGPHRPCPWGLGFEIAGHKNPHWTGKTMPPQTVGHFGVSGTYLWTIPAVGQFAGTPGAGRAMIALTDRHFESWAKSRWSAANDAVWRGLEDT